MRGPCSPPQMRQANKHSLTASSRAADRCDIEELLRGEEEEAVESDSTSSSSAPTRETVGTTTDRES